MTTASPPPAFLRGAWQTDAAIERVRTLYADGASAAEIAAELGVSKGRVRGVIDRLGLAELPRTPRARPNAPRRVRADVAAYDAALPGGGPERVRAVMREVAAAPPPVAREAPVASVARVAPPVGKPGACCWPIGTPRTPAFRFCGAAAPTGRPYCGEHAALAFSKPQPVMGYAIMGRR